MLNSLLQNIEQRLAKKPFTWMSWWRNKRWSTFFFIVPKLTEERPLWKRDETSLNNLRLFNLEPQTLQAEVQAYWRRPFWQRWWLGLLTGINNKRKVWSYYQRCLAFGEVQKQHNYVVSVLKRNEQERTLLAELVNWLDENTKHCEKTLEKHAGDLKWLQNRFPSVLSQYEKKKEQEFLKRLEKKLKKITTKEDQIRLRCRIKKEYQGLVKVMRDYLLYPLPSEQANVRNEGAATVITADEATEQSVQSVIVSDRHELVYVGPAPVTVTRNMSRLCLTGKAHLGDMGKVGNWVFFQRQRIASLLEEGRPEACIEIKTLLEENLNSIKMLIEPQIQGYQQLISKARQGNVNYKVAIECSEDLQRRLMKFFRSSVLLFHPDKSNGNEDLSQIQTEFFRQFRQFSEISREAVKDGLEILKTYAPQCEAEIQKILDEIERDRKAFRAELAQVGKEIAQMRKEREEAAAKRAQERKEMKEEIEKLRQLMLAQNRTSNQTSKEATSSQERENSNGLFFRP
ncbi:hypothetical protein [Rickettsiella endosymbiont of Litargus connexus]|uniref:hypothetical protein n=1 Tax=Rickettsiella endosymbiont of Litargus connexus TaxID=3066237 RepID=UPI00376F40B1